jgi:hypothetical protein
VNKTDLRGLLAAVERARKTLEDTDAELDAIERCLIDLIGVARMRGKQPASNLRHGRK